MQIYFPEVVKRGFLECYINKGRKQILPVYGKNIIEFRRKVYDFLYKNTIKGSESFGILSVGGQKKFDILISKIEKNKRKRKGKRD